jgi:pimeloyl-ACP methyl ester carboxylesterase
MAYVADALVRGESETSEEALPLPKAARVAIFRALVKRTFADVYAYFFGGSGDGMRERMRGALDAVDGPVVVVSHSLGTIIAYDVLRERRRNVPLLITAGSPLAVQEIQDLVMTPLRVPDGVTEWRNVADGRDLVALDKTIRPEYTPAERVRDFLVVNDSDTHHGIDQYLRTPPVHDSVAALFR